MLAGLLLAAGCAFGGVADSEWELRGGNPDGHHFSALDEINEQTVEKLGLAWFADLPTPDGPVGTPIVAEGKAYVIGTLNIVHAYDIRTGKLAWSFDPKVRFGDQMLPAWGARITRGVAYLDGKVLLNTADCRLVAVDAASGKKDWEARVCEENDDYTITSAPRVGGGLVFVGPNNADMGSRRGYVDAYDVKTGRRRWRFHTIPGHPDDAGKPHTKMATATWDPDFLKEAAGGSVWEEMIYDAVTGLLYIGVGGITPWNPEDRGAKRGDELFSNSIVALDAKTGTYVWHYQTTPGDAWNLEPTMSMAIADMTIDGEKRRVVMQAPKNGFFYVLDAKTGKLVNKPRNFVPVNWAKEIDLATGRPVPSPDAEYWKKPEGAVVYPGALGAHNFNPMSYNPGTGLVYIPALHLPTKMIIDRSAASVGGAVWTNYQSNLPEARWPLVAWDPIGQKARWQTAGDIAMGSGVLSTAGNVVFQGASDGVLRAYRASDGKQIWSFDTGAAIVAAPVTVRIDGVQTLLVVVGSGGTSASVRAVPRLYTRPEVTGGPQLLAFRLDGEAKLPPGKAGPEAFAKPPLLRPDKALAERGKVLFETRSCELCHGAGAETISGSVPDLRRSSAEVHAGFEGIVRGGALQEKGMPMFFDIVTPEESKMLQAFVLDQAWNAYEANAVAAPTEGGRAYGKSAAAPSRP